MQEIQDESSQVQFLKSIGHESRTLLNGITGPVQLLRAISDNPNMLEPLRILELSVSRLDKFSFRTLLLADLQSNSRKIEPRSFDLVDMSKHILLELDELLDFYNIRVKQINDTRIINVINDYELTFQNLSIIIERSILLAEEGSVIQIDFSGIEIGFTLECQDSGLTSDFINKSVFSSTNPTDIDLLLFKACTKILKLKLDFSTTNGKSLITYIFDN